MVNKQASDFWFIKFYAVLELFESNSWLLQQQFKPIAKKIFDFLLCFKGFRFNRLEISISEAVTTQYWIGLWNAE